MDFLPVFLNIRGKKCLVVGGGEVALRKATLLCRAQAQLWIVASLLGIFFQPMLGHAIDRFGPKRVLMADAVCIVAVCLGYGFSHRIGNERVALWLLYACFVGDQLLFGANMAREIYLSQIAESRDHVAPTLSLGITINHAVSMIVPALGGLVWMRFGHHWVFIGAAGVGVIMFIFSSMIHQPTEHTAGKD